MSYYLQGKRQADRWVYSPRMHVPWAVMCMNIRVHSYSPNFCSAMKDPLNESLLIFLSPVIYHLDCPSLITLEQLDNQNWQSILKLACISFLISLQEDMAQIHTRPFKDATNSIKTTHNINNRCMGGGVAILDLVLV